MSLLHKVNIPQPAKFNFVPHIKVWPAKWQRRPIGPRQQAKQGKAEPVRPLDAKHFHSAIEPFQALGIVWRPASTLKRFLILSTGVPS